MKMNSLTGRIALGLFLCTAAIPFQVCAAAPESVEEGMIIERVELFRERMRLLPNAIERLDVSRERLLIIRTPEGALAEVLRLSVFEGLPDGEVLRADLEEYVSSTQGQPGERFLELMREWRDEMREYVEDHPHLREMIESLSTILEDFALALEEYGTLINFLGEQIAQFSEQEILQRIQKYLIKLDELAAELVCTIMLFAQVRDIDVIGAVIVIVHVRATVRANMLMMQDIVQVGTLGVEGLCAFAALSFSVLSFGLNKCKACIDDIFLTHPMGTIERLLASDNLIEDGEGPCIEGEGDGPEADVEVGAEVEGPDLEAAAGDVAEVEEGRLEIVL